MATGLRFGRVEVQAAQRQLLIDGVAAPLGSRAFDLLMALIERRDRVVDKSELIDLVWHGAAVEENNLHVQINTLRRLLGRRAIATVSRRGYRFILGLQQAEQPRSLPAATAAGIPPHLPTTFVGREAELDALTRLLGASRLLTLTGIGGNGKTRLAIELAHRVAPGYSDGVRFADLAQVNSPDAVAPEIARVAGAQEERDRSIVDTLVRHIAVRHMLLILDNCEHVLDACAALVGRLLAESRQTQLIVTSREALGVKGEQIIAVRPLSLPAPGASAEAVRASEAVQLFACRARLVLPQFEVSDRDVDGVEDICRRLDGIPLAIELAAARLRVLSVEQIRDKLSDRFRLLTAGHRAVSRHQTLQAALQWSYEHLASDEQALLRRVSAFAGGWTLEAAMEVAGQGGSEIDLVDRLGRLVDKSLISVEHMADGSTRFGMLETVREYAQAQLRACGEMVAAHDSHLAHFLQLATTARDQIARQFVATLARIDSEIANLLAAHAWCDQPHVPAERGLELATFLRRYWMERDQFTLGRQVFEQALRRPGAERPTAQRAEALFSLGQHLYFAGHNAEALQPLLEALALARDPHDTALVVRCLERLSTAHLKLGQLDRARAYVEEAVELARAIGAPKQLSAALEAVGALWRFEGRFEEAAVAYEEGKRLLPPGDLGNQHLYTRILAYVAIGQERLDRARKLLIDSIMLGRQYQTASPHDLSVAAYLAAAYGDWTRAARFRGAVDAAADRISVARDVWGDPFLESLREKPRQALGETAYVAAWESGHALDFATALEEVLAWLGDRELAHR